MISDSAKSHFSPIVIYASFINELFCYIPEIVIDIAI